LAVKSRGLPLPCCFHPSGFRAQELNSPAYISHG
jgi:hypothetical protein